MTNTNSDRRCQHKDAGGKRCRMLRALDHPSLCAQHAGWLTDRDTGEQHPPEDLTAELLGPVGDFRTITAINYALGKLALLVASHRISTKEAAILGYLFQLLLQTVPGVNHEISITKIDRTNSSDGLRHVLQQTASLCAR